MHARKNLKREEKLHVVMTAVVQLNSEGKVITMRRVAARIGYAPSTAIMNALFTLCDRGMLQARPKQHRGAVPTKWTFEPLIFVGWETLSL